jgi:hypothetical protein
VESGSLEHSADDEDAACEEEGEFAAIFVGDETSNDSSYESTTRGK